MDETGRGIGDRGAELRGTGLFPQGLLRGGVTVRILSPRVWDSTATVRTPVPFSLPLTMKAILFSLALGLGLILAGDTGGGSTAPKGTVLDFATGGGSTAPKGTVLDLV